MGICFSLSVVVTSTSVVVTSTSVVVTSTKTNRHFDRSGSRTCEPRSGEIRFSTTTSAQPTLRLCSCLLPLPLPLVVILRRRRRVGFCFGFCFSFAGCPIHCAHCDGWDVDRPSATEPSLFCLCSCPGCSVVIPEEPALSEVEWGTNFFFCHFPPKNRMSSPQTLPNRTKPNNHAPFTRSPIWHIPASKRVSLK
jgi:hypothetical protein